ncbi:CDR ABC transporter-domain-containing protein [Lentinula detonsa]|uniref:CDR ABC transporter-domain-containing protein n=1 Tax=Lentinula detonsa TaxID=2804962 RepID=A0AA38PUC0_9AGAR|nr:CDR ABC transporter-domain-containing protein [Lentinula detonsa]
MSMIFRTIGATPWMISQAMAHAAITMLGLIIYTSFTIPIANMHPCNFPCITFIPSGLNYTDVTGLEHICATTGAEAGSSVVEGASYLIASFNYYHSHMWRNLGIIFAFMVFFLATALTATEYITAAKSKGEVLVFRRGHIPVQKTKLSDDEESAKPVQQLVVHVNEKTKNAQSAVAGLQKQTSIFHWEDVCYDIKIKGGTQRLLDNVDGWVKPGTLTGASGAGKTTLLDTLASRVTMGVVTGSMFVDKQQRDESFQRKTGYVQQLQDLHLQTSTVREALPFRLNVEQRKRLTIGVTLAAKPKLLLFLDEPTSGLDSQTAWSICTLLRDLANNGQAILCTIHQPSALLFQEFDRLLFLAHENSKTLTFYFERQGASPCPPDANPAEWMLQVIGAAPERACQEAGAFSRPPKAYSWVAFMLANICAELPWNTLMSIFIFFGWYYPIGLYRNAEPTGALFLMVTSTFTHMIIAAVEVAENGGNITTLLFSLTILFCGVLVTPSKLPGFWIFMYRVSPFTYLVNAMLSVSLANAPASCSSVKVSVFNPPSGQTCGQYLCDYISFAGGALANPNATSQCEFHSITDTNVFLAQVNSFYSHHWRNFGLMWAYSLCLPMVKRILFAPSRTGRGR